MGTGDQNVEVGIMGAGSVPGTMRAVVLDTPGPPCAQVPSDPRVGPSAKDGWDWVASVHARQLQRLARTSERHGTPD
jgi:hypothetical protein